MERRDFLRQSAFAGLGLSLMPTLLQSCQKDDLTVNFQGKVLIIGAGSAGMMAAYTLQQFGIDFEIIEAGANFGGRVKKITNFVDFPVDLGAEWLHDDPETLGEMINDPNANGTVDMISYQPESIMSWDGNSLTQLNTGSQFYREYKFKNTTWHDFFEDFIVPSIASKMHLNEPVSSIEYNGSQVSVTTTNNTVFNGDRVIVTVPVPILQQELITFTPALPSATTNQINAIDFPPGIKVFLKFSNRFYPDICSVDTLVPGEKIYFDGAFKKGANDHMLTLFYVSESASELTELSDADIFTSVMTELDQMFDGKATQYYLDHVIQNWSNEAFIQGSHSHSGSGSIAPVQNVYFAGEAFTDGASSTVHGAGFSGRDIARAILQGN
ncbi:MAG: NAD(P)/FAD-dependent oxidoreductase [Crocinitomicaceae bacterium]|nr:NAD(P)/FAD-dependent oxidoreductase [Crocinitomicaceae bacterium]